MAKYRVYTSGTVVHQDDFSDYAYSDEHYSEHEIPDELIDYLANSDARAIEKHCGNAFLIPPETTRLIQASGIELAREEAIRNKFNRWSLPYIVLGQYADSLREGNVDARS